MRKGGTPTDLRAVPVDAGDPVPRPTPARPAWRPRRARWWFGAGAAGLICLALLAAALWPSPEPATTPAEVNGIVDKKVGEAITALQAQPPASVAVYDAIRLPLVAVHARRPAGPSGRPGLGSGVVVNARGDILTSLHVVEGAATISVQFSDGTESAASVRSSDADHDIAVLAPATLPDVVVPAVLGGGAQVGDEAFAVGHPLGLVGSFSSGVISGLGRSFPVAGGRTLEGMIQFDAAVNPGNSGGPLLNRNGQVIGIVTGLANPAGDDHFAGISFAVPIGTAGGAAGAPAR